MAEVSDISNCLKLKNNWIYVKEHVWLEEVMQIFNKMLFILKDNADFVK